MGYALNVDTRGTYTDVLFSDWKNITWVKADITPHDYMGSAEIK